MSCERLSRHGAEDLWPKYQLLPKKTALKPFWPRPTYAGCLLQAANSLLFAWSFLSQKLFEDFLVTLVSREMKQMNL